MEDFLHFVKQHGIHVSIQKGEYLFRQGELLANIFVVQSGLFKASYLDCKGKETIKSFIVAQDVITSLSAVYGSMPSSFSLLALESSHVISLPFSSLINASQQNQLLANNLIELLMQFAMKKERREYELLQLSAEQRLVQLFQKQPSIVNAVTQNDLAKYIGITPVGLSRIKKRLMPERATT